MKGESKVLPEVGMYRNMEVRIFQIQRHPPVQGFDGVLYEGRSLHFESWFEKVQGEHF
ncbi:hypothetical protein DPMN_105097 [Dreissena polymorpha]|uniref:Uncharacterized protein n=1 Tax=Dreissena polymorpha TaxID=45954 RepID=A0A9D4H8Y2_DREPO|nr:hypothetical protein DPMN_105097 [Dreissena polymorpha]